MEKQQQARAVLNEVNVWVARIQEEMRGMESPGRQQLHDLTRLRIERNRAAKHARCAIMRMQ